MHRGHVRIRSSTERHAPPRWTSRIDREKQNRRGGSRPSHGRSIHSAARSSLLRAASFRRRCRQRLYVDSPAKATKAEGEIPLGRPLERKLPLQQLKKSHQPLHPSGQIPRSPALAMIDIPRFSMIVSTPNG
jgi:hypothetical protein